MIAAALAAGGLAAGAAAMARPRCLPIRPPSVTAPQPEVSIVIPARNAETTIVPLLMSLDRHQRRPVEVIVVDDASSDATGRLAAAHGARVLRLEGEPPAGWTGKAHACHRGASVATAPLLMFLDADVTLQDGAVDRLVAAHTEHGGLISVQPYHRIRRPYETLSAVCNVVAMMGSGAFTAWRRVSRPAAFGPCLLTGRDDYFRVGGHAAIRGEVVEDVALAKRFDAIGLPVTVFSGWGAVEFRMYPDGPRQLIEGWTKNLASGVRLVDPVASAIGVWWVSALLALTGHALAELTAGDRRGIVMALAAYAVVAAELRWMWRRVGSFGWPSALVYPIATVAFVLLFLRSAWFTVIRRRVRWSGRSIELSTRRTG